MKNCAAEEGMCRWVHYLVDEFIRKRTLNITVFDVSRLGKSKFDIAEVQHASEVLYETC